MLGSRNRRPNSPSLGLNIIFLVSGRPEVHAGVVIAGSLDPEGSIAVGGLAAFFGRRVHGDIDVKELNFLASVIL